MDQDQVNRIYGMIQALGNQVQALEDNVGARFNALEYRVSQYERNTATHSESIAVRATSQSVLAPVGCNINPAPQAGSHNPQQATHSYPPSSSAQPPRSYGSFENAGYLPFAIEAIAKKHQNRHPEDGRNICYGAETFSLRCFFLDHYRWCRRHQRRVIYSYSKCGLEYQGCNLTNAKIYLEVHPDWERIVSMSYAAGLGSKGVHDLDQKLFPRNDFPEKNEWNENFEG
ncbi:hypothetical protein BDU57DRAFT_454541 [Ampelomyces quisqualis]|uniref:Uncharacterized protein n=1 Tax=Ampelomyces quisqualis TaxID=50730 RepID=A0A6A5QHM9_AMPQU|nr:hypothetical protein BDU57DRAFT_454541 [Ampelomyces quisqualis]